jgi:hypothetical protein
MMIKVYFSFTAVTTFLCLLTIGGFDLAIGPVQFSFGIPVQNIGGEYGFVQTLTISLTWSYRIRMAFSYVL